MNILMYIIIITITFFLIVGRILLENILQEQKYTWLKRYGLQIDATVTSIILDEIKAKGGIYVSKGAPSYYICAAWQHPYTQKTYKFYSNSLIGLPTEYSPGRSIKILINPNKPEQYYMEL